MRVTIVTRPRPLTNPNYIRIETIECEHVERHRYGQWLALIGCKSVHGIKTGDYCILEKLVEEVRLEDL
jgi:hypothetical protein